ncbi:T9SS type A sorting domain-containing protein [Maribellus comscasis]|uniref:T9SS type A sorting domain-containing protein n=1 Tax=Maribellus comscasis TaxID=2681766 RepID=A0A6I6JW85_9BACT|nr:T9SS type A sorting domain-containing protein [Maribellus comscasis]QGY44357.1 T9SS type A sorting domain-containing protein [Maribellus comscasis]
MRRTLLIVLTIVTFCNVKAQKQLLTQTIKGESQINIALDEVKNEFSPPPTDERQLKSGSDAGNFLVTYENVPTQAKAAFQYAVSIWEGFVSSPVPLRITVKWEELGTNMLAQSRPSQFYKNFDGALFSNVYYPVALAEKLAGKDINGENEADIVCSFNSNISWYYKTDGDTPSTKYDFITAALHEITHGLGFSGFLKAEDGNGYLNNTNNLPSIYDYYIYNFNDQRIADNDNFKSPSSSLFQQLTSEKLKFNKETVAEKSATPAPNLYAPENWIAGSSLYHLDHEDLNSNDDNNLMTAYKYKGQAIHTPGDLTVQMLAEMGWKSVSFDFEAIKDFEETCLELPLQIGINSEIPFDPTVVKIIFSKDYFTTKDSVSLSFDASLQKYTGNLPVNNFLGNIQYYFVAQSANNIFKLPSTAPNKKLTFRIGPDYSAPIVFHNPVKLVSSLLNSVQLTGKAEDNLGIKSVKVEYKVDGIDQEPVLLTVDEENFSGTVELPGNLQRDDKVEYRIVASDNSKNNNKIVVPSNGYYSVNIFEPGEAVSSYETDFNDFSEDFIGTDFDISTVEGFSNGVLHSNHPYQQSNIENEKLDQITQLKYPVIIKNNGQMSFKEVVLVEPGEPETKYTELLFWDYVIVEASIDYGKTWIPLTEGYDSNSDDRWYSSFVNSLKSNASSTSSGDESLFATHIINLTENTGLQAGDEALIRFRLSSDKSVNGWGWAIDDLTIQSNSLDTEEIASNENIEVYPNPFADNFYVDCSSIDDISALDISVTDLTGKTVFREIWNDPQYSSKKQVNLNSIEPGIYLVNMVTDASQVITKKIVKY